MTPSSTIRRCGKIVSIVCSRRPWTGHSARANSRVCSGATCNTERSSRLCAEPKEGEVMHGSLLRRSRFARRRRDAGRIDTVVPYSLHWGHISAIREFVHHFGELRPPNALPLLPIPTIPKERASPDLHFADFLAACENLEVERAPRPTELVHIQARSCGVNLLATALLFRHGSSPTRQVAEEHPCNGEAEPNINVIIVRQREATRYGWTSTLTKTRTQHGHTGHATDCPALLNPLESAFPN